MKEDDMNETRQTKQVIVVRKDLNMSLGKTCAQVAHASMMFMSEALRGGHNLETIGHLDEPVRAWIDGSFTKVVVGVDSLEELLGIMSKAEELMVMARLVVDEGRTEFKGKATPTAVAIGPGWSDEIDKVTGHLKLLSGAAPIEPQPIRGRPMIKVVEHQISDRVRSVIADAMKGKSWKATMIALDAVEAGRNVLFISCENSTQVVNRRFDMEIAFREGFANARSSELGSAIESWTYRFPQELSVRCYPMGSVTIREIQEEVTSYVSTRKKKIDLIVFDAVDEVHEYPGIGSRENQARIQDDFVAMCRDLDVDGVFTRQANRYDECSSSKTA